MGETINKLLDLPARREPDTETVRVPRLDMELTLREVSYNKIMQLRGKDDADLLYLMESIAAPDVRDKAWWREHMGCPSPVEALKKLLKKGEAERLCRIADKLNGYAPGSVLEGPEGGLEDAAIGGALEDLEKN